MTFLEALKTGRPMRRASWWGGDLGDRWMILDGKSFWIWAGPKMRDANPPTRGDMLADDWEVMP